MDDWMGNGNNPITLNKYTYGNIDPVNVIDPSGRFGLASFGAANSIRSHLSNMQIEVGMSLLDTALDPDGAAQRAGGNALLLGVASMGGAASFKLLRMLSSKFRKACAANSFTGGTLVSTAEGLRPIEEIEIGDLVWAFDEETGQKSLQNVIHFIQGDGEKDLVDITLENGDRITATIGHPFFSIGTRAWVDAGVLSAKDSLFGWDGQPIEIADIELYSREVSVVNLTIDIDSTYYVGTDGILTHNSGPCRFLSREDVPTQLRRQAQERHIFNHPNRKKQRGDTGGYFYNLDDATDVLDAVQGGRAIVLGRMKNGNILVHYKFGQGRNHSPGSGFPDQPTNRYVIKGKGTASVVPVSPNTVPFSRFK